MAGEQSLTKDHGTIMIVDHGTQARWRRKRGGSETGWTREESTEGPSRIRKSPEWSPRAAQVGSQSQRSHDSG